MILLEQIPPAFQDDKAGGTYNNGSVKIKRRLSRIF